MTQILSLPWLELAIVVAIVGSVAVPRMRDAYRAWELYIFFSGSVFVCASLALLCFYLYGDRAGEAYSVQPWLFGRIVFAADELTAPLLPLLSLVYFLTGLVTARSVMRRNAFAGSLAAEALRLLTFSTVVSPDIPGSAWILIGLLAANTIPPYFDLVRHGKSARVFLLHMGLFVALLVVGWALVEYSRTEAGDSGSPPWWAILPLLMAVLLRSGIFPMHTWVVDLFENAGFGHALLFVLPLSGVLIAIRLVIPIAPDWAAQTVEFGALITAVYSAGMAATQRNARRFFAHLFISHSALVLVGLDLVEDHHLEVICVTGALALWFSVMLTLGSLGLIMRALEARFGRLSLTGFLGLYDHSPTLAVCFLLTALASVGFPGTLGFISIEILVDGTVGVSPWIAVVVAILAALNGIAVVRAYLILFTGTRHPATFSLGIVMRERLAVTVLIAMIIGGGLFPQAFVSSRYRAAESVLKQREAHIIPGSKSPGPHQ